MDETKSPETSAYSQTAPSLANDVSAAPKKKFDDLPPAAQRALKEAEARRKDIDARHNAMEKEVDGRGGLEPTRYDDWEIKGLTVDF
ncbi:putative cytoplasmic protein [Roseibium sp. TrichSKD4]|uniref:DUF1674 domain-containing protein n=1 Tax=Roseibium sp. TrichSKD4 TaxID=744980 RepID=UPI0001E567EE|nr:DUF1674 domain-containing protein [Roseibium sp. TrichSKD4]EFO32366.1 putative cytoplasmic protein [Roseibium sp. TrichSKD4]